MDLEALKLAGRLLNAAGRIESGLYVRPTTAEDLVFFLDWSDGLIALAERLVQEARHGTS